MDNLQFHKRDTSWLAFNHRVLQEAMDENVPLYERIKFLAIYSSNLDEFYRVRVSALRRFKQMDKVERKQLIDIKPKRELNDIKRIVHQQQMEFGRIFRQDLLPALRKHHINLIHTTSQVSTNHRSYLKTYFIEQVLPKLDRQYLKEDQDAPFLQNRNLYLVASFANAAHLGLVNIPSDILPRFLALPEENGQHYIIFLDDIIRLNMQGLFEEEIAHIYSIKVSRDAELYIDDEFAGDLLEKIKSNLANRDTGLPTRLLYDSNMSIELTTRLKQIFQLKKNDLFPGGRYHNFSDFFGLPDPTNNPDLKDIPLPPLEHPVLAQATSLIDCIHEEDQLLNFPYQKYEYVPQLILEAADHPEVETIKITLYRVASKSAVVNALLIALEKGKKVVAFIEAKARFDEASNIFWGKELEVAGATVLYSYPAIKVHTKLLLIQFNKESAHKALSYLGTGNFNEKTARLYCDHALLTAHEEINKDVEQVFGILERKILIPDTKKLFVSPFSSRTGFQDLIDKEMAQAEKGKPAYMMLKMNSLEDQGMIKSLYKASQAGVEITLIVRGICCLVPGVAGLSENIKVFSLVDRFLEHARVYIFGNKGNEKMYIASADWMTRNLDRRIEVVIPILNQKVYQTLRKVIDIQISDNTKLRSINSSLDNPYIEAAAGAEAINAQSAIYRYFAEQLEK